MYFHATNSKSHVIAGYVPVPSYYIRVTEGSVEAGPTVVSEWQGSCWFGAVASTTFLWNYQLPSRTWAIYSSRALEAGEGPMSPFSAGAAALKAARGDPQPFVDTSRARLRDLGTHQGCICGPFWQSFRSLGFPIGH